MIELRPECEKCGNRWHMMKMIHSDQWRCVLCDQIEAVVHDHPDRLFVHITDPVNGAAQVSTHHWLLEGREEWPSYVKAQIPDEFVEAVEKFLRLHDHESLRQDPKWGPLFKAFGRYQSRRRGRDTELQDYS